MPHGYEHIVLARHPMPYDHRDFRMLDFITPSMRALARTVSARDWTVARILDQGNTPHCVGFAWAGFGISLPVFDDWQDAMGDDIYYKAKEIDGEPGQENGSTTRSGVQAFMSFGSLEGNKYAFAQGPSALQDIKDWILSTGPVIVGTNWYNDMFTPDANGVVSASGGVAGGHEYMLSGYDTSTGLFKCTNSWGTSFGVGGQFYMTDATLVQLLNEQGDACVTVEVSSTPVPPPPPPTPNPPPPSPAPGCIPAVAQAIKRSLIG